MKFHVLTLFPEMIKEGFDNSITGRALSNGKLELNVVNIRDYSLDKHKKVDDYPYGGGAGMLMFCQPVYDAFKALNTKEGTRVVFLTPGGKTFNQSMASELSKEDEIVFLCGHYEGIDERVIDRIVTDKVSIGDYVLTGGELPALVMMDSISRLVPGVLGNGESFETESYSDYLLEYPQFSRPEEFMGERVPEVLLSGDHKKIEEYRLEQSINRTIEERPDLFVRWAANHPEYFEKELKKAKKQKDKLRKQQKKLANTD